MPFSMLFSLSVPALCRLFSARPHSPPLPLLSPRCPISSFVTALLAGHQAHATSAAHTTNLAAVKEMHAPISPAEHTKLVSPVANKQLAIAKAAAHPIKTQHLEEAPAEAPKPPPAAPPAPASAGDDSDDSIDLLPPKEIKGGKGKALESSIEEAFEDKPSSKNSHYLPDHTDKVLALFCFCCLPFPA